jgi:diketogulonate reductase-like aldo/keto reductase
MMPWCRRRSIPIMAYSPVEQGRLLGHPTVKRIAERHDATPAQVAPAWMLRQDGIIAIPKAGTVDHVRENRRALDLELTQQDLAALDRAFPPPTRPRPLEML